MIEINLTKLLNGERGTKKEWRTVTRGGKTFRQRFATGKKESESEGVTMISIKDTKSKKLNAIDFIKSLGWDAAHSKLYAGYASDTAYIFMERGGIVAISDLDIKENTLEIEMLEVNPSNRRQGKGVDAMKNIAQYAIDNNIGSIELESMDGDSDKFYDAIGMADRGKSKFPGRGGMTCYEGDQEWMKSLIKAK